MKRAALLRVLAKRLLGAVPAFVGTAVVGFALSAIAGDPVTASWAESIGGTDPGASERLRRLRERYALDLPLFLNFDVSDSARSSRRIDADASAAAARDAQVWLAAARGETGAGGVADVEAALRARGDSAIAPFVEALLDADAHVRARGFRFLATWTDVPEFGAARGAPGVQARDEERRWNESTRRAAEAWWRRHRARYEARSTLRRVTLDVLAETRFGFWLGDLLRLDFGDSLAVRPYAPVSTLVAERLPKTLLLMMPAFLLIFAIGAPIGFRSAVKIGSRFDRLMQGALAMLHAAPEFWLGSLAFTHLCSAEARRWFPTGGLLSSDVGDRIDAGVLSAWSPRVVADAAWHLALPVATLVLPALFVVARQARSAVGGVLASDFALAARARGYSSRDVLTKLVPRHAAPPLVTLFTSSLPALLAGSIAVERIFDIDGMGLLTFEAALSRDVPVAMGVVTISALMMILASIATDVVHAALDPRVRLA